MNDREIIADFEKLIRQGKFQAVQQGVQKLNFKTLPRDLILTVANALRRINRPVQSVRLLNPIIRPPAPLLRPATPAEQMEYADALRKLGAVPEAMRILENIPAGDHPQALFFLALCYFSEWRYQDAVPVLRKYVDSAIPAYARLVGQVNLAAALIHSEHFEEGPGFESVQNEARTGGHHLLLGNSFELLAQIEMAEKNWNKARTSLDTSLSILKDAGQVQHLWAQKWRAVIESREIGKASSQLKEVVERAKETAAWETYRDCSAIMAGMERNASVLNYVYHGTPFTHYRQKLLRDNPWFTPTASFLFRDLGQSRAGKTLDLASSREAMGPTLAKLTAILCSDFFKPIPLVGLFSQLFPEEFFSPQTSANRVHQNLRRLRRWFERSNFDIALIHRPGSYALTPQNGTGIMIKQEKPVHDLRTLRLNQLNTQVGHDYFSIWEAKSALHCSEATAQRFLRWANESGKIAIYGRGRFTRYRLIA